MPEAPDALHSGCTCRTPVASRPLLDEAQSRGLEAFFKVLGNATRLRLLHALVIAPGTSLTHLAEAVGMRPQAVSNQLRRLLDRGIVAARRDGNRVRYEIVDPCTVRLLEEGLCVLECSLSASTAPAGHPPARTTGNRPLGARRRRAPRRIGAPEP